MEEIDTGTAGKTLSKLIARVQEGETFLLTRYGKPAAMLVRASQATVDESVQAPTGKRTSARRVVRSNAPTTGPTDADGNAIGGGPDPAEVAAANEVTSFGGQTTVADGVKKEHPPRGQEKPRSLTDRPASDGLKERPSPWEQKYGGKKK
jgi:antitoxin (DNA-binding transcriptional repressor) of toxin-antitoxin stability system